MSRFLLIPLLLLCVVIKAQKVDPTVNIMMYTFQIQVDSSLGSSFVTIYENGRYLVTAKHLFKNKKSGDVVTVYLAQFDKVKKHISPVYFHPNPDIDVAVLKFRDTIHTLTPMDVSSNQSFGLAQEVLFLGYPLGLSSVFGSGRIPLVKKAIVSGILSYKGYDVLLLDGHNNFGFSGGPVITKGETDKQPYILGVISGYMNDPQLIGPPNNRFVYDDNSGIIRSFSIRYVHQIIRAIQ